MRFTSNRKKIPYVPKKIYKNFIHSLDNSFKQYENNKKDIEFPEDKYDFKKWYLFSQKLNQRFNQQNLNSKNFIGYDCKQSDIMFSDKLNKKWRYDNDYKTRMEKDYYLRFTKIIPKKYIEINDEITDINSLLNIIDKYPLDEEIEYSINMKNLHKIKDSLKKLNEMIGLQSIKTSILDTILYFMQDLHKSSDNKESIDFMHTVFYGPPGTGKTEIAMILGEIYSQLGILKKGIFRKVTRSDLIGGYLGQTALKTKAVIDSCLDGVLFIDEAYSLGNEDKKDMYAKECLDTLCESASFYKDRLLIIIAGYEEELKTCFFSYNQGLESRFQWRYNTDKYNSEELLLIMKQKINKINWSLSNEIKNEELLKLFESNYKYFSFYGRDIENFLTKIKIAHSRNVFSKSKDYKRVLTMKDFNQGLKNFILSENIKNRNNINKLNKISHLYS